MYWRKIRLFQYKLPKKNSWWSWRMEIDKPPMWKGEDQEEGLDEEKLTYICVYCLLYRNIIYFSFIIQYIQYNNSQLIDSQFVSFLTLPYLVLEVVGLHISWVKYYSFQSSLNQISLNWSEISEYLPWIIYTFHSSVILASSYIFY